MKTRSMSKKIKLTIFSSLPQEIIISEILPRQRVKSLLRFKWASKSWFSLISSIKFAKTHLMLTANNTPLTDHNAILVSESYFCGFNIGHCTVGSLFSQSSMGIDQFDSSYRTSGDLPRIAGCCNGICFMIIRGKHFILWNPSTGESRRLPSALNNEFECVTTYGFGYDESNDDYKVVAVLRTKFSTPGLVFKLYSLKTNSWKTVDDFLGRGTIGIRRIFRGKGTLANGKLHWMSDNSLKIVSFDLRMEAAGVVESPRLYQEMGVIKGCLSVIYHNPIEGAEVWVMKEYGVKESWCRVVIVPHLGTCFNHPSNSILCISEDGVVFRVVDHKVVDRKSTLFLYNPKTKLVSRVKVRVNETCQVDFCIQSLVSPFRHGELKEPN